MPLPQNSAGLTAAQSDLGFGGLQQEVKDETEEMRKKRMQEAQQRTLLGPAGSMAVTSLFGMNGGGGNAGG